MVGFLIIPSVVLSILLIVWFFYIVLHIFSLPFWVIGKMLSLPRKRAEKRRAELWERARFSTGRDNIAEHFAGMKRDQKSNVEAEELAAERRAFDEEKERARHEQQAFWEEMKRVHAATERAKGTSSRDPYEILGVARDAAPDEIKARFRTLSKQYHPDMAAQATPEIQELAEQEFRKIKDAYETLAASV